jgi:hypothetical protein
VWNVSDEFAGRLVRCKNCDQSFTVEEVTGAPVEAAPAGAAAPAPAPTTPAASTGQSNSSNPGKGSLMKALNSSGDLLTIPKILLIAGFAVVILSRGCDSIGSRGVAREKAVASQIELEARESDDEVSKEEREEIEDAQRDARAAANGYKKMAYFYEMGFILGTILLVAGAGGIAATGTLPERIAALAVLVIVTFSIYVIGAPWLVSAMQSAGGAIR